MQVVVPRVLGARARQRCCSDAEDGAAVHAQDPDFLGLGNTLSTNYPRALIVSPLYLHCISIVVVSRFCVAAQHPGGELSACADPSLVGQREAASTTRPQRQV